MAMKAAGSPPERVADGRPGPNAVVAVIAKIGEFRGESRFTT